MLDDAHQGFADFYDTFLPQVYRYVQYRVTERATAEGLTAHIFEKALRAWPRHQKRRTDSAPWIFRIAHNTVISHYRHANRRQDVDLAVIADVPAPTVQSPEAHLLHTERWHGIRDAVRTLSQREQHAIALKFGSDLSNRAIAPILGISEGHVAVILHRALRKVQKLVEDERVQHYGKEVHVQLQSR